MSAIAALQWVEVETEVLTQNLRAFAKHMPQHTALAPVVKSNAYGHGLQLAARAFAAGGASWFCVHSFTEAKLVAELALGRRILILGPLADHELQAAIEAGFDLTVYDAPRLRELAQVALKSGYPAKIHLKVETGTWRQGVTSEELASCLAAIKSEPALELAGVHSHYANIEDTTDHSYAEEQSRVFEEVLEQISRSGLRPQAIHMSCSAAAILFPSRYMDLARIGISAYGYWPSSATLVSARKGGSDEELSIGPALSWKVRVAQLKTVPAGSYIGYGCTDKAEVDTRLALLPVGYADGYSRSMSGRAHVLLHGKRCAVRGRICMNLMMVDVTHLSQVELGDEAVLLGTQEGEKLTAETLAEWAGTIHYEVLARISPALPRIAV
jgi:alanine racemase